MKNIITLFLIATLGFCFTSRAQIKKGSIFLGGDIGGSSQKTKSSGITTNTQSSLTLSPVIGIAVKDDLVVGGDAGYVFFSNKPGLSYSEFKQKDYSLGVFVRKYKPLGKSNFFIFLQARLGGDYNSIEQNLPSERDITKGFSIGINAYPGISYAISKRLYLETGFNNLVSLDYSFQKEEQSGGVVNVAKTKGFGISSSLNNASYLYIGFRLFLNKK